MAFADQLAVHALDICTYVQGLGPVTGPVAFIVLLTVWVMIGLPCTILEMVPGFLFGYNMGVFCNTFGKWLGSMISYGIARIFSEKVDQWCRKHKAYRLCTKAMEK